MELLECDEVKRDSAPSAGQKSHFNRPVFITELQEDCSWVLCATRGRNLLTSPPESTYKHRPAGNTLCSFSCYSQGAEVKLWASLKSSSKHDRLPAPERPNSLSPWSTHLSHVLLTSRPLRRPASSRLSSNLQLFPLLCDCPLCKRNKA